MNILIIGSGGREHALAWKILQSPRLSQLYMTAAHAHLIDTVIPVNIPEQDKAELVAFAQQKKIDVVVIGNEAPLAAGVSDALREVGIKVFGPSSVAAQIEASKSFAKDFMSRHHIPTAAYKVFSSFPTAMDYVHSCKNPIVIKAAGLAAGKGVFLPDSQEETETILRQLLIDRALGTAANEIVIEERLQGEEISLLAFTDGKTIKLMPFARDHKRLRDNDQGPNTGGMGAYAPASHINLPDNDTLLKTIFHPTIAGLAEEKRPFVGVLYAGLILTDKGPYVLEFNCRFGDPETQVILPLLESDLIDVILACCNGTLAECDIRWRNSSAVCVVLASEGYPHHNQIGDAITGLDNQIENTLVFHAATRRADSQIVTAGGRVLGVIGLGKNIAAAAKTAYQRVNTIHFQGMQYRKDIGQLPNQQRENPMNHKIDHYANAGVNITVGNEAVKLMSKAVRSTYGSEVLAGIGAFGGMYDASAFKKMQHPVLVASTDGIGTKVHLAAMANRYNTLGHDIVNHSVNDILVQGAKPLFFLDYVASSKLDAEKIALIVTSMAEACREVNCALLGGETAEMPGVYMPDTFDVAGTIVGIVEREQALPRPTLKAGDVLIGVASSGAHTNGYSLIRKIFHGVPLETVFPELGTPLVDALLAPHRCYLPILQTALQHEQSPVKALIHITGGGFLENIPRVLPADLSAKINPKSWPALPLFQLIQQRGGIPDEQMFRVFNMGIGMIVVCAAEHVKTVRDSIKEITWVIGELVAGERNVTFI